MRVGSVAEPDAHAVDRLLLPRHPREPVTVVAVASGGQHELRPAGLRRRARRGGASALGGEASTDLDPSSGTSTTLDGGLGGGDRERRGLLEGLRLAQLFVAHERRRLVGTGAAPPRQHCTGGKPRLLGVSKQGNGYLRRLLVLGAQSVRRSKTWRRSDDTRFVPEDRRVRADRSARRVYATERPSLGRSPLFRLPEGRDVRHGKRPVSSGEADAAACAPL